MFYLCLSMGIGFFTMLFRLAVALHMGVPVLYTLLMSTVFSRWYDVHKPLAEGILFVMLICVAASWIHSGVRTIRKQI